MQPVRKEAEQSIILEETCKINLFLQFINVIIYFGYGTVSPVQKWVIFQLQFCNTEPEGSKDYHYQCSVCHFESGSIRSVHDLQYKRYNLTYFLIICLAAGCIVIIIIGFIVG